MGRARAVWAPLLVVAGAGLLAYGLFQNSVAVSSNAANPSVAIGTDGATSPVQAAAPAAPVSEAAMVQEVARGGVTRDGSGQVKKTYEEGKQAPKACPT